MDQSRPWETKAVVGSMRLLQRIWRVLVDEHSGALRVVDVQPPVETLRALHRTIVAVRDGMRTLRFNIAIAKITELTNHLTTAYAGGGVPLSVAEPLILMLAPLAPHVAEELWSMLGHPESLTWVAFPVADPTYLVDETIEIPVQVNGKVRSTVHVPAGADTAIMEAAARADSKVDAHLATGTVRKVIAVPGRLVNFVVT
nr:class I tRNA ligase family protein [Geodermatophilaceae bacterium]